MISRLVLVLASLAACSPEPRSVAYFDAHPEAAEQVVADCKVGTHRGQGCANAQAAVAAAERHARMDAYRKGF